MTKEDKDLLLNYLCMALPYKVKVRLYKKEICTLMGIDGYEVYLNIDSDSFRIENIKPYLRPLSSITEEERLEISNLVKNDILKNPYGKINPKGMDNLLHSVIVSSSSLIKWLLEKHFDFMELTSKDLAIAITKENNPY